MRRTRLGGFAIALLLVATAGATVTRSTGYAQTLSHGCGHERWPVKTLADNDAGKVGPEVIPTTVEQLINLGSPETVGGTLPRQIGTFGDVELTTFRVTAHLDGWKISPDDKDIHLVILDPKTREPMIVEFPKAECVPAGASAMDKKRMAEARAAIMEDCKSVKLNGEFRRLLGTASITGIGFFDKIHNQIGVADNGIELHPVVRFSSSNCRG